MNDSVRELFSLEGKVAVVTGASRGIGAAIAGGLAGAGAWTVGLGRSTTPRSPLEHGAQYRACDVTDHKRFAEICAEVAREKGRIDILVNAAGISTPNQPGGGGHVGGQTADAAFDQTIAVNLGAAYHCCQAVIPYLKKAGGGAIINVTSVNSEQGFPGNPGYVASKGGLRMMTKAFALDLGSDRIRVNSIAPGYIHTDMTQGSYKDPVRHAERLARMMLKRWGEPADLVGAAIFLASEASSYVTGADLFVDGGWTAKGM